MNDSDRAKRITSKISINPDTGCWLWTGAKQQHSRYDSRAGYPKVRVGQSTVYLHRYMLSRLLGRPIRSGYVCHHQCGNRSCVNPAHLEEEDWGSNVLEMWERRRGLS